MQIGILGENEWTHAMAILVAQAGHTPQIGKEKHTDYTIRGFKSSPSWQHIVEDSELVIIGTLPQDIHTAIQKAHLRPNSHVLVRSGMSRRTQQWLREVIINESPALRVGIIGNGIHPQDIIERNPTAMVIASAYQSVQSLAQLAFHSDLCRLYYSQDTIGLEIASIFTDMIHFGMGVSDALANAHATRGALVSRGLIEGARLGGQIGAQEHSFLGLAGIGNLIANIGRNKFYQMGQQQVIQKHTDSQALELLETILDLNQSQSQPVELPITEALHALCKGKLTADILFDQLMRRKATRE